MRETSAFIQANRNTKTKNDTKYMKLFIKIPNIRQWWKMSPEKQEAI